MRFTDALPEICTMGRWKSDIIRIRVRSRTEREFFIDNLLVRIYFFIAMNRWTGLAP